MKTFLIVFGIVAVISMVFIVYVKLTSKAVIYNGISDRGKEYLKVKRNENDREWQGSTLEKPVNANNAATVKTVKDEHCFEVMVPIPASELRKESECQYRFFLAAPVGDAVVSMRKVEVNSINDVADISMRKLYKEDYLEKQVNVDGRIFLTFKKKDGGYERSAFFLNNKELFIVSFVIQTNEDLDKKFDEMLKSIKIYND